MKYVILICLWVVALTQSNGTMDLFCFRGENANTWIVVFILSDNGMGWRTMSTRYIAVIDSHFSGRHLEK
jgi:hypothetical protein